MEEIHGKLTQAIIDYLDSHKMCTIATARDNQPGAHTVYYINDGLDLYFTSDPATGKVQAIQHNPKVAVTVDEDYADWRNIKGVQMIGEAHITPDKLRPQLLDRYTEEYPFIEEYGGVPDHHVFVHIRPGIIYYLDYKSGGFGNRRTLRIEKKQSILSWGNR